MTKMGAMYSNLSALLIVRDYQQPKMYSRGGQPC